MSLCKRSCSGIHASALTSARHRCGMQVEFAPKRATCLKESRKPTTATPGFGEDQESQQQSVASAFLGTPLGHADYVQEQLNLTLGKHNVLLSRIPLIEDVQSAWSLSVHCAGARANYLLRVVRPKLVRTFAEGHNRILWNCLNHILSIDSQVDETVQDLGSLPLSMGGLGLRSATRTSQPAFWASWADCLAMIRARHPDVAALILLRMQGPDTPPTLAAAAPAARCLCLSGVEGFEPPSWETIANGERPPMGAR